MGQQYEGRVLPGVRIGSTELGGLTREQAEAEIANAYVSMSTGQITLTGPNSQTATISYADVGRAPDTTALVDAALVAGRQGEPIADLIGAPKSAIHGITLDLAVAYDRDKLAEAVETIAARIDQVPVNASVSANLDGTFNVSAARSGRAVDTTSLLTALDQQLGAPKRRRRSRWTRRSRRWHLRSPPRRPRKRGRRRSGWPPMSSSPEAMTNGRSRARASCP